MLTYLGFIVHSTPWTDCICISASYAFHFDTGRMYVFMHCADESQNLRFFKDVKNSTCEQTYFLLSSFMIKRKLERIITVLDD